MDTGTGHGATSTRRVDDGLEGTWPKDPLKAAVIGLRLSAYFESSDRYEDARKFHRYAEHEMRERLGHPVELTPGQALLTRAEAQHWLAAWDLAFTRNFVLPELKRRRANQHVRKVKRNIAGLRRQLRAGTPCQARATSRVGARARGAGRPRARRTASPRAGPSDDPGEPEPGPRSGPLLLVADPTWGRANPAMLRTLRKLAR